MPEEQRSVLDLVGGFEAYQSAIRHQISQELLPWKAKEILNLQEILSYELNGLDLLAIVMNPNKPQVVPSEAIEVLSGPCKVSTLKLMPKQLSPEDSRYWHSEYCQSQGFPQTEPPAKYNLHFALWMTEQIFRESDAEIRRRTSVAA